MKNKLFNLYIYIKDLSYLKLSIILIALLLNIPCIYSTNNLAPSSKTQDISLEILNNIQAKDITPYLCESYSRHLGGKGFWMKILESFADELGYKTPASEYIFVETIWNKFIDYNLEILQVINEVQASPIAFEEKKKQYKRLLASLEISDEIVQLMKDKTKQFKGEIIIRSSGVNEDSFTQNLAGIFTSIRSGNHNDAVTCLSKVLLHTFETILINQYQNNDEGIKGVPKQITKEEGMAFLVQHFISFKASGTAMTNLYGMTSIETVFGDADAAVRVSGRNVIRFLFSNNEFKKIKNPMDVNFDYGRSFQEFPDECKIKGKNLSILTNPDEMINVLKRYPVMYKAPCPITENELHYLSGIVTALEEKVGVPLDVEWGFDENELYIIQIRPIIGDFKDKNLTLEDEELAKNPKIISSPVSIGQNDKKGFTGHMVLFSNRITEEEVKKFEEKFDRDYIRVQYNVADRVGTEGKTKAKVLVDPVLCTRQAHSINLIMNRVYAGDFVYTNGQILKNRLTKYFRPHPDFKDVWISKGTVTVFSNGLWASFYKTNGDNPDDYKLGPDSRDYDVIFGMGTFNKQIQELLDRNSVLFLGKENLSKEIQKIIKLAEELLFNTIFNGIYSDNLKNLIEKTAIFEQEGKLLKYLIDNGEQYAFILSGKIYNELQAKLEILEEVLSNPLLPSGLENNLMVILNRIAKLKGIKEKIKTSKTETAKKQMFSAPNKLKVLYLEDNDSILETAKRVLPELVSDSIELIFVNSYENAVKQMEKNTADAVVMDLMIAGNNEGIKKEFKRRINSFVESKKNYSELPLIVVTGFDNLFDAAEAIVSKGFHTDVAKKSLIPYFADPKAVGEKNVNWDFIASSLEKFRVNQLMEYEIEKAKRTKENLKKSRRNKKMQVLFIESDNMIKLIAENYFPMMHGEENIEFHFVSNVLEANRFFLNSAVDVCIWDVNLVLRENAVNNNGFKTLAANIEGCKRLILHTNHNEFNAKEKMIYWFENLDKRKEVKIAAKEDYLKIGGYIEEFKTDFDTSFNSYTDDVFICTSNEEKYRDISDLIKKQYGFTPTIVSNDKYLEILLSEKKPFLFIIDDDFEMRKDYNFLSEKINELYVELPYFIFPSSNPGEKRNVLNNFRIIKNKTLGVIYNIFSQKHLIQIMDEFFKEDHLLKLSEKTILRSV